LLLDDSLVLGNQICKQGEYGMIVISLFNQSKSSFVFMQVLQSVATQGSKADHCFVHMQHRKQGQILL